MPCALRGGGDAPLWTVGQAGADLTREPGADDVHHALADRPTEEQVRPLGPGLAAVLGALEPDKAAFAAHNARDDQDCAAEAALADERNRVQGTGTGWNG